MFSRKIPCDRIITESIAIIGFGEEDIVKKVEKRDNSALEPLIVFPPSHKEDYHALIFDVS